VLQWKKENPNVADDMWNRLSTINTSIKESLLKLIRLSKVFIIMLYLTPLPYLIVKCIFVFKNEGKEVYDAAILQASKVSYHHWQTLLDQTTDDHYKVSHYFLPKFYLILYIGDICFTIGIKIQVLQCKK
jgi:hypothetical protein